MFEPRTLARVAEMKNVVAIKEAPFSQAQHEADCVAVRAVKPRKAILVASDNIIFSCMTFDSDGTLLGIGNVIPTELAELYSLTERGDLAEARRLYTNKIYPITSVIWPHARSFPNIWCRVKWMLHLLGRLESPAFRQKGPVITTSEKEELRQALTVAGLLKTHV